MLIIKNLYAGYTKDNPILKGIDLTVDKGQVVGILGRNGSGKSTLAKAICGLVAHTKGDILFEGRQLMGLPSCKVANLGMGYFQQGGRVFPSLTVLENLNFTARYIKQNERKIRLEELKVWFELLQKDYRTRLKSSYLSGGEKHQLALAMVLLQKPRFLILDEPSAGLSPANQTAIYDILKKIRKEENLTMMVIEQNVELANKFIDSKQILDTGVFI